MSTDFNIVHFQGDTFILQVRHLDSNRLPIDLTGLGYTAELQVRRSPLGSKMICQVSDNYPEGCYGIGTSGDFSRGNGTTGTTGGISMDYDGVSGAIYVEIDRTTSSNMPKGRHFYDLEVSTSNLGGSTGTHDVSTILNGTFEITKDITS